MESDVDFKITLRDLAETLFAPLVFLSTFVLVFDFIQNREQLLQTSITDTTVKEAQKKAVYISIIPTIIAAFILINTPGLVILLLVFCAKFFFVNS